MEIIPNQNDVLFGKGKVINKHYGNQRYRSIVKSYKSEYQGTSNRAAKKKIVGLVIDDIKKFGARFLIEQLDHRQGNNENAAKTYSIIWVEADKNKVIAKVTHSLREREKNPNDGGGEDQPSECDNNLELNRPQHDESICKGVDSAKAVATSDSPVGIYATSSHSGNEQERSRPTFSSTLGNCSSKLDKKGDPAAGMAKVNSMSMQHWISSACKLPSKHAYVESAVSLACILTKHLCQIMSASTDVNLLEDRIKSEKLLIFVDRLSLPLDRPGHVPSVASVKFQFEVSGVLPLNSEPAHANNNGAAKKSSNNSVCAALGEVLLELFSSWRSMPVDAVSVTNYNSGSQCSGKDQAMVRPTEKRQVESSLSSAGGSKSSMANNLLLNEVGMPVSICQLVSDLLDAGNEQCVNSALTSLDEALWDLTQMKKNPETFLFDRTHPQKALDDTLLFGNNNNQTIFGREKEIEILMDAKDKVSVHVRTQNHNNNPMSIQRDNFLCESAYLFGYAGCGKTSLLNSLINACNDEQWFVLGCKFDKNAAPHMTLAKAFDNFFGKWGRQDDESLDPFLVQSFHKVCQCISETVDKDGFNQLCDLIPSFTRIFPPLSSSRVNILGHSGISSMEKIGSGQNRLQNLFHILFKSLCSAGLPVLFTLDDLQWSGHSVVEYLREFISSDQDRSAFPGKAGRQGILIVGTYRSNEVSESDALIRNINLMKESKEANVTMLDISELTEIDITKLVSTKLCLPFRYTRELAGLVHKKTRGNPFFVTQFLRCIIQNKYLEFSVKTRQWEWDIDVVDMQMMSDGVAQLLISTFSQLPSTLIQTMKIVSCLGYSVEEYTIVAMNSRNQVLSCNMMKELHCAVDSGLMDQAGPVYAFSHDIIQQCIYDLVPASSRPLLHKNIGTTILKSGLNDPTLYLLGVDQINMCIPSSDERTQFAKCNAVAANHAIATSSFDQARSYIDRGLQLLLLDTHHWLHHYSLSLTLYDLSASVSFIHGDSRTLSTCLDQILLHAQTFDDSLKASSLLVQLLTSSGKLEEAASNCLVILSSFGEAIPSDISSPHERTELKVIQSLLRDVTYDRIKELPPMTDRTKLNTMHFLSMLRNIYVLSKPKILPLISVRMLKLTLEYGICNESIVGVALAAYVMFLFTDELQLGYRICKVCEKLIEENPSRHILRAKVSRELMSSKLLFEPFQSVIALGPAVAQSALLAGDISSALILRLGYCQGLLFFGSDLSLTSKNLVLSIRESARHNEHAYFHTAIAYLRACLHLSGESKNEIRIKSYEELSNIAQDTNNVILSYQNYMSHMYQLFWMREYDALVELLEFSPPSIVKRIHENFRIFYAGIAYLSLAQSTREQKWRDRGEISTQRMRDLAQLNSWTWLNKFQLLEASMHWVDGDLESAEAAYTASIASACAHSFINEEGLGYELYGHFLLENQQIAKGLDKLQIAMIKYKQWKAMSKVKQVEDTIKFIQQRAQPDLDKKVG